VVVGAAKPKSVALALLAMACAPEVLRVDLPPQTAPLRVIALGDGTVGPPRAWVVEAAAPASLPLFDLDPGLDFVILDYDTAPPLPPGEYQVAAAGEPAERLIGGQTTVGRVTSDGTIAWSSPEAIPARLSPLDLRVSCPADTGDPEAIVRLPRNCPLDTSKRGSVCYGVPVFSPSFSSAATASVAADFIDEALETVTESDGSRWIYGMSSRLDGPSSTRTLPARWRLSSPLEAVPGSYEPLPLFDGIDALRGWAQALRVRADGLEIFFVTTFPSAERSRIAQAWRSSLDEAWSPSRVRILPHFEGSLAEGVPLLLPDYRTLLLRSRFGAASQLEFESMITLRRDSTALGDGSFGQPEQIVLDATEEVVGFISASIGCDGRHLLYTSLSKDPADPAKRIGQARIVPIRGLDPLELGAPEIVPLDSGPLDGNTTLAEAPDCSALYISGKVMRVAPRVECL